MAVPAPARSPLRGHARCAISPDRALPLAVATAARVLSGQRARLLAVLAAVPDPGAAGGPHQLAVILGLALGGGRRPVIHGDHEMGCRRGPGHPGCVRGHRRSGGQIHLPADPCRTSVAAALRHTVANHPTAANDHELLADDFAGPWTATP
jgi:hypothetical protein